MPPAASDTSLLAPLTADENDALTRLLARASAGKGPAARLGEPYRALVNLSVPRRGDKDHATDLVMAGETVYLTEDEARLFNRHERHDGRQVAVLQKLSGPDGSREETGPVPPRAVSGRLVQPPAPPPGSDAARPDPEGSSRIEVISEGTPEAAGALSADPAEMADTLRAGAAQDALDLPPARGRQRRGQAGG